MVKALLFKFLGGYMNIFVVDWDGNEAHRSSFDLNPVVYGEIPLVVVRNLFSATDLQSMLSLFDSRHGTFEPERSPWVTKRVGTTFQRERYIAASEAQDIETQRQHIFEIRMPIATGEVAEAQVIFMSKLSELLSCCGFLVEVAKEFGAEYATPCLKLVGEEGLVAHFDWAPRNDSDFEVGNIDAQLAAVAYLATPQIGGDLQIFEKKFEASANYSRYEVMPYGYADEMFAESRMIRFHPEPGDLAIFNARYFHKISPIPLCASESPRYSASCFLGYRHGSSRLLAWS
jgi:hypothetical protein